MRVLHFYKSARPESIGGIEQVIDQIACGVASLGITTDVLALDEVQRDQPFEINGYLGYRAKLDFQIASTGFSVSAFRQFSKLAKRADLIHYHFPWPFMDLVHFASRTKKPSLVTYHSDIIRQQGLLKLYRPLKRRFLADVDHIVATSPDYLASSHVLERFKSKVSVIPIGLDKASYPVASEQKLQFWREQLGSRFFLFVGVIRYYKGLHFLLDAAKGTNLPVVIVGAGPIESELKAKAATLGLLNIRFLGSLPEEDKVALLQLSYAIVFPSHLRSEAFGVSLLEGAMYGKPMISSEIGTGTTFININLLTGLVVPPHNPDALREAMLRLWHNPAEAALMGQRAEQRYWELFTARRMAGSYVALYQQLAAKSRCLERS
jgi:rhamnosyl/mannosyltransferase